MTKFGHNNAAAVLDRHAARRAGGVPTVSLLVGPVGAGGRLWRRWAATLRRTVVVADAHVFPFEKWAGCVADQIDLFDRAMNRLAERASRHSDEFQSVWRTLTPADRQRFWDTLAPEPDDALLRPLAELAASERSPADVANLLIEQGERGLPMLVRLAPAEDLPAVLLFAESVDRLASLAQVAVSWGSDEPLAPVAISAPADVWRVYLAIAPDSRVKSLLKEGEVLVDVLDFNTAERMLREAGADRSAVAAIATEGVDEELIDSAIDLVRATATTASSVAEDDRARSAAERFLFLFLESMPETHGRFELNAILDFCFGPRAAEVDLLCRSARLAIEVDGYFHFSSLDHYRRDRAKDWELQRRGYVVLRFLAEDVIPKLETIRERILDALSLPLHGEQA